MIVSFAKQTCSICNKMRLHEVFRDLARCVRCNYVADVVQKSAIGDFEPQIGQAQWIG